MKRLAFNQTISLKAAREMVVAMAVCGNGAFRVPSAKDAQGLFAMLGTTLDVVAADCRHFFKQQVPLFENIIGSTCQSRTGGVAVVDEQTGQEVERLSAAGWIYTSSYQNGFEYALRVLHRGVESSDPNEINSAIVHGITTLDAFLLVHANHWNREHPEDQLIDNHKHKTSFDTKVAKWLPKFCGQEVAVDNVLLNDYRWLKAIRHDETIHPKSVAGAVELEELAKRVNTFRSGIAKFLFQLHVITGTIVPVRVIRACHAPDCVILDDAGESVDNAAGNGDDKSSVRTSTSLS